MSQSQIVESFEKVALLGAKNDISTSVLFRSVIGAFREWCRYCEPGWGFQAPKAQIAIFRMALQAPVITFVEKSQKEEAGAEGEQEPIVDPPSRIINP